MKPISLKSLINKLSSIGFELPPLSKEPSTSTTIGTLCHTLLDLRGEASAIAIAEEILNSYRLSNAEDKLAFFEFLFNELNPDANAIDQAIDDYQAAKNPIQLQALSKAAESPRRSLFRSLNMAKDGTHALIAMRADLQKTFQEHNHLKVLDADFLHLFKSWFNRGFLELKQIDWKTPAEILEKLIKYESVHEIQGWTDLRRRLEADRRCFGFFHPVMPNEPLIFVEVALTQGISSNIASLLEQEAPEKNNESKPNSAIFYSINNCFAGLRGVSFGNLLIKQVVEKLATDSPEITTYATLSPVPGYLKWLENNIDELKFLDNEQRALVKEYLKERLYHNDISTILIQTCAYYLTKAKSRGKPFDPVARFHLGNGACLERINWEANTSAIGLKQSAGIMVNYLYDPNTLTRNHEAYEQDNKVVCSNSVIKLLPS